MLAVSGGLNPKAGGPSIYPELPTELKGAANWKPTETASERARRSVYVVVKRNLRYPFFTLFDAPDRSETCARRFVTTTAPQALMMMNDDIVTNFAKQFTARVTMEAGEDRDAIVTRAYEFAFCRKPTTEEREKVQAYFAKHPGTSAEAVGDFCHMLLVLNEFLYVD
jgi:hypothetical protein